MFKLEQLNRGLIAAYTPNGIFISWRFMADEATGYSETGLTGANFNLYRDDKKIATIEDSTNYLDKYGKNTSKYYVCAVIDGKEVDKSKVITPWNNGYYDLPIKKPKDGISPKGVLFPNGETYTYNANDMSIGDVDGDGEYEYFIKWDPSNSKDVSIKGYTGNTYIDCYKFDGTLLYRIDLGVNIRSGAHYTQFMVYDFDGDGKAELIMKTAPGTKIIKYDKEGDVISEKYITMLKDDIAACYKNTDDYRISAQNYYDKIVKLFMSWDKHSEVVRGRWPKTIEECFGIEKQYNYPLCKEDAKALTDYFMDVYAPSRSERNKLREFEGFVVDGPEYLTVFNGFTGDEMQTIKYNPEREDDGLMWGDYAFRRIEPANRVDRFLAGVAYLDGEKPYAIFARGYYTRSTMAAYSWDGKEIKEIWFIDSGYVPLNNPFNDNDHGREGLNSDYGKLTNQGAHTLTVADVDNDGKDEIIYGGATIDHDGKILYSSYDTLPDGSAAPGGIAKLGHGDAIQVANIDPKRQGLEIFMCHEGGIAAPYGTALRDAATGEVIFGTYSPGDTGRCMVGDIDPTKSGLQVWSDDGFWQADGTPMEGTPPGTNANIKWCPDMTTQIVDGAREITPTIQRWDYADTKKPITIFTAEGTLANNDTKGNPCLVANIFGDWREELLLRKVDNSAIRIYFNTEITNHKLYTLMHDRKYRTDIARQNNGYNQPAYTSFYFASDTNWSKVPISKR